MKKFALYLVFTLIVFAGQFLYSSQLVTGTPPAIQRATLNGQPALNSLQTGPGLIYFWAKWCGVCSLMQSNVSSIQQTYPLLSVALRSGEDTELKTYLNQQALSWPVVNDQDGEIAQHYGVFAVPAIFVTNKTGKIVFTSAGYSSEWGLRIRLWLASWL